MPIPVIVDAVRTPLGRGNTDRGYYRLRRSDELAAGCVRALLARNPFDPAEIEDVAFGCVNQSGEQGANLARSVALLAGIPPQAAAVTINRLCGSSMQALIQAAHAIQAGAEQVHLVGGVEQMSKFPLGASLAASPKLYLHSSPHAWNMGLTAELLARREGISRAEQDAFALASHLKAASAYSSEKPSPEIAPSAGHDAAGVPATFVLDQSVRPDANLAALAALPPAFVTDGGAITAGNSSPVSDGAAALLVMAENRARELGLRPRARILATAVAGIEPALMGLGPVPAVKKLLSRAQRELHEIDLWEINEAFAVQTLACLRQLKLDPARVNIHGGAIALGHPLGASGARIVCTLLHAMQARGARLGVATMCIGFGQGIAVLLEQMA